MLRCAECGCICDPGDLINHVCDDCREKTKRQENAKKKTERLLRANWEQMRLEDFIAV